MFVLRVLSLEKALGFVDCEVHAEPAVTEGPCYPFFSDAEVYEP